MTIHPVSAENVKISPPATVVSTALELRQEHFDPEHYNFIPTVCYRDRIESYAKKLPALCGFDRFVIIFLHNKQKFWFSNTAADLAIPYHVYQLYHLDMNSSEGPHLQKDHFFAEEELTSPIDILYRRLSQELYHCYNLYGLVRKYSECTLLMYAGSSVPLGNLEDIKKLYEKTYQVFEDFVIYFLENNIHIMEYYYDAIKYARIYYDDAFRKALIHGEYKETTQALTQKEALCLHWASYGKTGDEIGAILNISPYTVRQHLKDAIVKLGATNITHAVFKAKNISLL